MAEESEEHFAEDARERGKILAYQDWDSGGLGAGAGRVTLIEHLRKYLVFHDAGVDLYSDPREALAASGIEEHTDATVEIWVSRELASRQQEGSTGSQLSDDGRRRADAALAWYEERRSPESDGIEPDGDVCPICGQEPGEGVCAHHLANFDRSFVDEGELGCGLGGGSLYEVTELGRVLDVIRLDCVTKKLEGRTPPSFLEYCSEGGPLHAYASALLAADLEGIEDTGAVEDLVYELTSRVDDHARATMDAIVGLLEEAGVVWKRTTWEQNSVPGCSSLYEDWWCEDPGQAARALSEHLSKVLSARVGEAALSEDAAVEIVRARGAGEIHSVSTELPDRCYVYGLDGDTPSWYVLAGWGDGEDGQWLRSGRLIVVSRTTGEVLYDGSAGDEG